MAAPHGTLSGMGRTRDARALAPLLVLCGIVGLVAVGFAQGFWVENVHNGLLAFSFGLVGAGVLLQRPGHREGQLFLAAGVLEAVMFLGRQVGHAPSSAHDTWWGWVGVWPLALTLGLVTWCILCFPEGRFLSSAWRSVGIAVGAAAVVCSLLSALWPVEYAAAGVVTAHPFDLGGADAAGDVWRVLAHPFYLRSSCCGWWRWSLAGGSRTASYVVSRR